MVRCVSTIVPQKTASESQRLMAVPSMFGKDLSEQVVADKVAVPVIVTKSIYAVEAVGKSITSH